MALINCHECGGTVSTEAKACPVCGAAPTKKPSAIVKWGGGFIGLCVVASLVGGGIQAMQGSDAEAPPAPVAAVAAPVAAPAPEPTKPACASDYLRCLAEEGIISASVYCPRQVERLAKHSVKWTDGFLQSKFDRFRWKDKEAGVITYIGGRAEFQNGFGAWTPVIYECDMGPDKRTVIDVRVREGRLPS